MRFFKRLRRPVEEAQPDKTPPDKTPPMGARIIIGVPGRWPSRGEIVSAIVQSSCRAGGDTDLGYVFAGELLMDTATGESWRLEVYEHDPDLARAFEFAGGGLIDQQTLADIASHTFTLYASTPTVSVESARRMLRVGEVLLKTGGMAVKIESTGLAHSALQWHELAQSGDLLDFYRAFVVQIRGETEVYSCGMHNFGLPDCMVSSVHDGALATRLVASFNHYVLSQAPDLADGHTYSLDESSPRYTLRRQGAEFFEREHPYHNPFGVWVLVH